MIRAKAHSVAAQAELRAVPTALKEGLPFQGAIRGMMNFRPQPT